MNMQNWQVSQPIGFIVGVGTIFACDSYSIGWCHFGIGSANYSTEHAGKACILIAATDVGFNTAMFDNVLDWIDHLLLRRYKYQRSNC